MEIDKTKIEFWRLLEVGHFITLKDEQTINQCMEEGKGVSGIEYQITEKQHYKETNGLVEWLVFVLKDSDDGYLFLIVKSVESDVELYVGYSIDGFTPGTRKHLISNGFQFVFNEPDDLNNFEYNELTYAGSIQVDMDTTTILYVMRPQGTLYAEYADNGNLDSFGTVTEYSTDSQIDNPYMYIFEVGLSDDGGFIDIYLASMITPNDIEII